MTTGLLTLFLLSPAARAFCGAYVGGTATNDASIVVVVRQGTTTTLTLVNDYGDATGSFGYVMPVPPGVALEDVATVDPGVIERMDAYSAPRTVAYTCDDVDWYWTAGGDSGDGHWTGSAGGSGGGCGGGSPSTPEFTQDTSRARDTGGAAAPEGLEGSGDMVGVQVSERTTVGAYDLAVVTADGADGLQTWLDEQGFATSDATAARLQDYIDAGQDFLVARIDLDTLPADRSWLEPLRIRYTSDAVSLPLWLGASSSAGEQDLLIFGVTTVEDGALAISNYDDFPIADECLTDDADTTNEAQWQTEMQTAVRAPWVSEFGWLSGKCDPCANDAQLTQEDLAAVGFDGTAEESFFTRIHLRYRPDQIDQDVQLYESRISDRWQIRYVQHTPEMEDFLPLCDGTAPLEGGECEPPPEPDIDTGPVRETPEETTPTRHDSGCCGGSGALALVIGVGWMTRRRR
jgi:hypothetical protein